MKGVFAFVIVVTLAAGVCSSYATSRWTKYQSSPTGGDLNAVTLLDANNGWAVGDSGLILRLREGKWSFFYTWPTQSLEDVAFGGPNFGLAVGYRGTGCVFNGTKWKFAGMETTRNIWGVAIPPGQNSVAWAVGEHGTVFRWTGGRTGAWSSWPTGTTYNLRDVHFNGPTDGWLCGDGGRVYYFKGTWTPVNAPTLVDFYCIYALSANDVWVGGTNGTIYHYDGVSWTRVNTPTSKTVRDMSFSRTTAGWAVCDGGTILRYKDGRWKKESINPPTSEDFSGTYMVSSRKGWAVGTGGILYEYRRFPAVSPASLGRVKALFR
jgi:photosystem II stability/assembly factor-like uncharacterized protein